MPPPGVWTRSTNGAPAAVDERIITPALAQALVSPWPVTLATIVPLPLSDWLMNVN